MNNKPTYEELMALYNAAKNELDSVNEKIAIKDRELDNKNKELNNKSKELESKNKELDSKNKELSDKTKELDKKDEEINEQEIIDILIKNEIISKKDFDELIKDGKINNVEVR